MTIRNFVLLVIKVRTNHGRELVHAFRVLCTQILHQGAQKKVTVFVQLDMKPHPMGFNVVRVVSVASS